MGTCCETICKHRILFSSIQHLAWLPQGRPQGKQNVVKIAIFGLTHWLKHRITRKLLKSLASIELSFHRCNILCDTRRGISRGNKNVGCSTWKRRFFALAVPMGNQNVVKNSDFWNGLTHWLKHRVTRKPLKTDRYMLRGVWQALNCLPIHATYCVIVAGTSPQETKMWAAVRENFDFLTVVNYTMFAAIIDSFMSN